eukprot:s4195_g2.t1
MGIAKLKRCRLAGSCATPGRERTAKGFLAPSISGLTMGWGGCGKDWGAGQDWSGMGGMGGMGGGMGGMGGGMDGMGGGKGMGMGKGAMGGMGKGYSSYGGCGKGGGAGGQWGGCGVWQPMFNAMMMSMMGKGSGKNGLRNFTTDRKVWVSGMPADNVSKEINMKLKARMSWDYGVQATPRTSDVTAAVWLCPPHALVKTLLPMADGAAHREQPLADASGNAGLTEDC